MQTRRWLGGGGRVLLAFLIVLLTVRAVAPDLARRVLVRTLSSDGVQASVGDVDLALWRAAARVQSLRLVEPGNGRDRQFLFVPSTEITLDWSSLLRGRLAGDALVERPQLDIVARKRAPATADEAEERTKEAEKTAEHGKQPGPEDLELANLPAPAWQERVARLLPLTLDRLEVRDATIRYRDLDNGLDLPLREMRVVATNLTNRPRPDDRLPATVSLAARTPGNGSLRIDGRIDPLADLPTFRMRSELSDVNLPEVNAVLRGYAGFDVAGGRLDLYVESAAADGAITGSAKPIITDLNVVEPEEVQEDGLRQAAKEAAIGSAAEVLESDDRQAAVVPIEGRLDAPGTDPWRAVRSALGHAFIEAIRPGFGGDGKGDDGKGDDGKKRKS